MKFPHFLKDKDFKHFISLMLNKDQISRLFKLKKIKEHSWFSNFNWEALISMNLEVPHIPNVNKDDLIKSIAFLDHVKTIKEWIPTKETTNQTIYENTLKDYEKWFVEF